MGHFNVKTLRAAVGHSAFYSIVAELDPDNAGEWLQMVQVQETFRLGEGDYGPEGVTYSESMRHTLHWSVVFIFEDETLLAEARGSDGGLLGYFVRLHPTAFKANGACELNMGDSWAVTMNTHGSMVSLETAGRLLSGAWWQEEYEVARRAADHVREIRATAGQSVTPDGYAAPPPTRQQAGQMSIRYR